MRTSFFLTAALLAVSAFGQGQKGSISGVVTNPGGGHTPGVAVQAKLTGSQTTARATIGADGKYTLADVRMAAAALLVSRAGPDAVHVPFRGSGQVTAALLGMLRARGVNAATMKPVQTGAWLNDGHWTVPDLDTHHRAADFHPPDDQRRMMALYCYEPACSPHLAARMGNRWRPSMTVPIFSPPTAVSIMS